MKCSFAGRYWEFSKRDGDPSIREFFSDEKRPNQNEIVWYLKNGKVNLVSPGWTYDVVTGKKIPGTPRTLCDREYEWPSDLVYYVEKYNLRLPDDFEDHILRALRRRKMVSA